MHSVRFVSAQFFASLGKMRETRDIQYNTSFPLSRIET